MTDVDCVDLSGTLNTIPIPVSECHQSAGRKWYSQCGGASVLCLSACIRCTVNCVILLCLLLLVCFFQFDRTMHILFYSQTCQSPLTPTVIGCLFVVISLSWAVTSYAIDRLF